MLTRRGTAIANAYGHVSCCGITNGCDQTYDEQNLSPYGVQYYLYKQWLSGAINLGFSCNANAATQVGSALQAAANSFRTLFCDTRPPALTMPASPGGACIPACMLTIQEPAASTVSGLGSVSTIQVSASTAACGWTADSAGTWITAVSGLNSSGMGTATFSILPNQSSATRAANLIVGGIKTPISQSPCAAPCPSPVTIASVVSGAPGAAGIAANSWVTIYGSNLAASTRQWRSADFSGDELPLSLDGVGVRIDGFPAAISYVSPGQLNVQAPDDGQTGVVQVEVTNSLGAAVSNATLARHAPAWFLFPGARYVAAIHADGTYLAPAGSLGGGVSSHPAAPGEVVSLFGTGFGVTDPATGSGVLIGAPATLQNPALAAIDIQIGGQPATIQFAGLIGPGLYQFNVVIPQLPDGDAPVIATIAGITTLVDRVISIQY